MRDRWFKSSPRNQSFSDTGSLARLSHSEVINTTSAFPWTSDKGLWTLPWQSEEMNLSDAQQVDLLLK